MATLTVNGRKVKVDDSFLSLPPDQQEATVNEIAASLGNGASATANANASAASQQLRGRVADLPSQQPERPNLLNSTLATVNGLSASVPFLQNATDAIGGGIAQLTGGDYGQYVDRQRGIREGLAQSAPLARTAGEVTGYIAAPLAAGSTRLGAEALGLTGSFGQRVLNSGLSGLGFGTADAMSNGATGMDAITQGAVSGGVGAAMPVLGAGIRAAGRGVRDNFIRPLATLGNRENEVTKRIAGAIGQDQAAGAVMSQGTEAVAGKAGADVLNADRFGSAIRTLARTASNVSPEADNIFKETTQNRFYDQGKRAINYVRALMGGATDDLALQDQLRTAARATNKTAYDAAYNAPKAKAIWTPEIRNLMTADPFKQAVREADKVAANAAAISGQPAIRNPFVFDVDGNVTGLRKLPGGGTALPNLEFWDIVQRNLRNTADQAKRSGDNLLASQVQQMRSQLLNTLDGAVPQFQKARQGAAGFFGAEDAIEAGRKAVNSTKAVPEIERAVAAMSQAEKDAFSVGFSSEIIDAIGASRDRVNVINSIFGSESARKRIAIALGPQRARELEAYVKMEQVLDMLRVETQGNSTTAKQLIQAGLMGGGGAGLGYIASGGDLATTGLSAAVMASIGRRGLQMLGKSVDDQVMKRVAEVLSSTDPAQLQRAIQNASLSKAHIDAIDGIMRGLSATSRGVGIAGATMAVGASPAQAAPRPLQPRAAPQNPFDLSKMVPPAARVFAGTLAGDKSEITERSFSRSELDALSAAVAKAESEGRDYIDYGDYDESLAVNPKNGLPGDKILGGLFDTKKSMAGVIGRAKFRRLPDGSVEIVDQYDFENMSGYVLDDDGKMVSIPQTYKGDTMRLFSDTLGKSGLYQAIRVLGENAAPEGEGRNVRIRLPS